MTLTLTLAAAGLASSALASHAHALLEIDNRFDGEAAVYVDGRFRGNVEGDARLKLDVGPGRHHLEVRRPGTGYLLTENTVSTLYNATVSVRVQPPQGTLRLVNNGQISLRLQAADHSVWVSPGTALTIPVPTGNVPITASIREPRGDFKTLERVLWVEPGVVETEILRPNPGVIRVVNQDCTAVRVRLDGDDAGMLQPGETRTLYVRPGDSWVTFVEPGGTTRLTTRVEVIRGGEAQVVLRDMPGSGATSGPIRVSRTLRRL